MKRFALLLSIHIHIHIHIHNLCPHSPYPHPYPSSMCPSLNTESTPGCSLSCAYILIGRQHWPTTPAKPDSGNQERFSLDRGTGSSKEDGWLEVSPFLRARLSQALD